MSKKLHKSVEEMIKEFPLKVWVKYTPAEGFWVQSPRLATCFASGDTASQAMKNFKYAVFDYFDVPMAHQDPNLMTYTFVDLPESDGEADEEPMDVNINIKQLVGSKG